MKCRVATFLCFVAACASGPVVRVGVEVPAVVPLRTFPRVYLASQGEGDSELLADDLRVHLASTPQVSVSVESGPELERRRVAGQMPLASVVVVLDLRYAQTSQQRVSSRPETICGPGGCFTRQRQEIYEVPQLDGRLVLSVYDGPSARLLQRMEVTAQSQGRTEAAMQERVLEELSARVAEWVDTRVQALDVRLARVDLPAVERALEQARTGDWPAARQTLERVVAAAPFEGLGSDDQAAIYYDLGLARRFDRESLHADEDAHFAAAEDALERAVHLDPREIYAAALASARAEREARRVLGRQREASEHNFALESAPAPAPGIPPPPPGYE